MTQETTHTPEPWFDGGGRIFYKKGERPIKSSIIAKCFASPRYALTIPTAVLNSARIVACVNACAGMADPAYEIAALRARVAELEKGGRPMNNCTHEFAADGPFKHCVKCGLIRPTMGKEAGNGNG